MAIMERVTYATVDGESMGDPHSDRQPASCAYCRAEASAPQLATWGFENCAGRSRYICPDCVRGALPQIETFLSY